MYVSVAIDLALDRLFTYEVPVEFTEKLRVGQLLRVPFSGRIARGFAVSVSEGAPVTTAGGRAAKADGGEEGLLPGMESTRRPAFKRVMAIEDETPFFSPKLLELVKWIAGYWCVPIESALKVALPSAVLRPGMKSRELLFVEPVRDLPEGVKLSPAQRQLLEDLQRVGGGWLNRLTREFGKTASVFRTLEKKGAVAINPREQRRDPLAGRVVLPSRPLRLNDEQAAALELIANSEPGRPVLLHGVTGSGKTEIYLQAIARELDAGRGAIVLVPEISLTPQTVRRFAARFGSKVAVLHSALSDGERYDEWHRIRSGEARVVVGPRSAVFAPVHDLGLIVVDEEHDSSYKQEDSPRYHARDVAVARVRLEGARLVLGSATPSLESWVKAKKGAYSLASVPHRVGGRSLPAVHLVDMNDEMEQVGHVPIFSKFLMDAISSRLDNGEQSILFLNRRGYSSVMECPDCGWVAECPDCSIAYTYHRSDSCLRCHVCGGWTHLPESCPNCHNRDFGFIGIGTQRAEAALKACFPRARILRMDADSTSRRHSHEDILSAFRNREADVLLGTQMIAKGLDFPNVTLVGVLNADTSLNRPDPRASERTYQLLAQVSGRAGRAEKPGEVYIQTFSPDAPAVAAAADSGGFEAFADEELAVRRESYMPPWSHISVIVFKSKCEALVRDWAGMWAVSLSKWAEKVNGAAGARVFRVSAAADTEAPLARAEGWFRHHVVLRTQAARDAVAAFKWIAGARPPPKELRVALDVDAQNFM